MPAQKLSRADRLEIVAMAGRDVQPSVIAVHFQITRQHVNKIKRRNTAVLERAKARRRKALN